MNGKTKAISKLISRSIPTSIYGLLAMATLILGLSGCGGGSSEDDRNRQMTIDVPYPVTDTDRLVVTSLEPAEIRVQHTLAPDLRTVTLLSGSAELLRGNDVAGEAPVERNNTLRGFAAGELPID